MRDTKISYCAPRFEAGLGRRAGCAAGEDVFGAKRDAHAAAEQGDLHRESALAVRRADDDAPRAAQRALADQHLGAADEPFDRGELAARSGDSAKALDLGVRDGLGEAAVARISAEEIPHLPDLQHVDPAFGVELGAREEIARKERPLDLLDAIAPHPPLGAKRQEDLVAPLAKAYRGRALLAGVDGHRVPAQIVPDNAKHSKHPSPRTAVYHG